MYWQLHQSNLNIEYFKAATPDAGAAAFFFSTNFDKMRRNMTSFCLCVLFDPVMRKNFFNFFAKSVPNALFKTGYGVKGEKESSWNMRGCEVY